MWSPTSLPVPTSDADINIGSTQLQFTRYFFENIYGCCHINIIPQQQLNYVCAQPITGIVMAKLTILDNSLEATLCAHAECSKTFSLSPEGSHR